MELEDVKRIIRYAEKRAEEGNVDAMLRLARYYRDNDYTELDEKEFYDEIYNLTNSKKYAKMAADAGSIDGLYEYAYSKAKGLFHHIHRIVIDDSEYILMKEMFEPDEYNNIPKIYELKEIIDKLIDSKYDSEKLYWLINYCTNNISNAYYGEEIEILKDTNCLEIVNDLNEKLYQVALSSEDADCQVSAAETLQARGRLKEALSIYLLLNEKGKELEYEIAEIYADENFEGRDYRLACEYYYKQGSFAAFEKLAELYIDGKAPEFFDEELLYKISNNCWFLDMQLYERLLKANAENGRKIATHVIDNYDIYNSFFNHTSNILLPTLDFYPDLKTDELYIAALGIADSSDEATCQRVYKELLEYAQSGNIDAQVYLGRFLSEISYFDYKDIDTILIDVNTGEKWTKQMCESEGEKWLTKASENGTSKAQETYNVYNMFFKNAEEKTEPQYFYPDYGNNFVEIAYNRIDELTSSLDVKDIEKGKEVLKELIEYFSIEHVEPSNEPETVEEPANIQEPKTVEETDESEDIENGEWTELEFVEEKDDKVIYRNPKTEEIIEFPIINSMDDDINSMDDEDYEGYINYVYFNEDFYGDPYYDECEPDTEPLLNVLHRMLDEQSPYYDPESAIKIMTSYWVRDNAQIYFELGNLYFEGKHVQKNTKKAVKCWKNASDNGYAEASYRLAYAYYYGDGHLNFDLSKAKELFEKAIYQGFPCEFSYEMVCLELGQKSADDNKMRQYAEKIISETQIGPERNAVIKSDLIHDFGEYWFKLDEKIRDFIYTGIKTYINNLQDEDNSFDYSAAVNPMASSLEATLEILFRKYINWLETEKKISDLKSYFQKIGMNFDPKTDLFTLGTLKFFTYSTKASNFDKGATTKLKRGENAPAVVRKNNSGAQVLELYPDFAEFADSIFKKDAFSKQERMQEITAYIINFVKNVEDIRVKLRNKADHTEKLKPHHAEACGNILYKTKKLLYEFISKLKD